MDEHDDLQSDELEQNNDDLKEQVIEPENTQDSDSDPDSEDEHEEKPVETNNDELDDFSKEKVNERIGELTRKRYDAERETEQANKRARDLEEQLLNQQEPIIPELPDPDVVSPEEYQQAVQIREKQIEAKIKWQHRKTEFENQGTALDQRQQQQKQQRVLTAAATYQNRATKLGVKTETLQAAGSLIGQVGVNEEVAMEILEDELGPLITCHLANNQQDLSQVIGLSPVKAAIYIERNVKPKLKVSKRKSKTPKPASKARGGSPSKSERFPLTGGKATFE